MNVLKCLVVKTAQQAKEMQGLLGKEWMVMFSGQATLGYHFSVIVLIPEWNCMMTNKEAKEWLTILQHRLLPDKKTTICL
jgi:hypothetical protein